VSAKEIFIKGVETINNHNAGALASLFAANAIVHDPFYPDPLKGRDAIEQDMVDFFRAFPNMKMTLVGELLETGDTVAGIFRVDATHDGPLASPGGEIPPTGRPLSFEGVAFSRYNAQGEVIEQRRFYDVAGQLAQLGLG
jgi:predicted ester cyclase